MVKIITVFILQIALPIRKWTDGALQSKNVSLESEECSVTGGSGITGNKDEFSDNQCLTNLSYFTGQHTRQKPENLTRHDLQPLIAFTTTQYDFLLYVLLKEFNVYARLFRKCLRIRNAFMTQINLIRICRSRFLPLSSVQDTFTLLVSGIKKSFSSRAQLPRNLSLIYQ